jgi:hypothetical protein
MVGGSADEPLVLVGPPRELSGRISVHNPGDAKVVLRDAGLNDPSGLLRPPSSRYALPPLVLRPDQGLPLSFSIGLDPATPPGEYRAELELGGQVRPVVLYVAEALLLTASPRSFVIANMPGVPQRMQLIITNDGNVTFTFGNPFIVDLRDDMLRQRSLRGAMESLPGPDNPKFRGLVAALVAATFEEEEPLGTAQVRADAGPVEVQPGETKAVTLEVTVQDELAPNRRYRGRLPVLTRDVELVVVASDGPVPEKAPVARRHASSEARGSSRGRGVTR